MRLLLLNLLVIGLSSASLLGGWSEADQKSDSFKHVLNNVKDHAQNTQNTDRVLYVESVIKAMKQLVNGMNYKIKLVFGHTGCRRNSNYGDVGNCQTEKTQTCEVKAYTSFSDDIVQIKEFNCGELTRVKRSLLGGREPSSHDEAREALAFVVESLSSQGAGVYEARLHDVEKVEKQVVAGIKYYVTSTMQLKSCENRAQLSACPAEDVHEEVTRCEFEVVDRAWLSGRFVLVKAECDETPKAGKLKYIPHGVGGHDTEPMLSVRRLEKLPTARAFQMFKVEHGKVYDSREEGERRMKIFAANLRRAKFHQSHDLGTAIYGATQFSDLTEQEFKERYLSKEWDQRLNGAMRKATIPSLKDLPKAYDWRNHSAVTSIKNQKSCGSCWAFSVVGNIEGMWAIKHGELVDLSAQELVDCDKLDEGCNGGLPAYAYAEIQRLGGLETETDYPYHGRDEQCSLDTEKIRVYINGSVNISTSEKDMAAWLVENGPMSIGINALFMQFYMGGISHPWPFLCPKAANHGVVIVGYGVGKGWIGETPYWIVKNSWGTGWGEHGYYLVHRGSGACGLNLMVSSAVID